MNIHYINYKEDLTNEFYTNKEVRKLLRMSKDEYREQCECHNVTTRENEVGEYGLVRNDFIKLHHALYDELVRKDRKGAPHNDTHRPEADPWE